MSTLVKILFHTFDLVPFLLTLDISHKMPFCLYCWFWTGKYRLRKMSKMEDLCDFQIIFLLPLFRPSVFRVVFFGVFFYIPIYREYYSLLCHDFKVNIQEEKTIFKMAKSICRSNILNERSKICFYWYFGLFPKTIFKVQKTRTCFIYAVS